MAIRYIQKYPTLEAFLAASGDLPTARGLGVVGSDLYVNIAGVAVLVGGAGGSFDQDLNTDDEVTFAGVTLGTAPPLTGPDGLLTFTSPADAGGEYTLANSGVVMLDGNGAEIFRVRGGDPDDNNFNSWNLYVGKAAGANQPSDNVDAGYYNVGIGPSSLTAITTGYENVGVGVLALSSVTSGNRNVALGHEAGSDLTTGRFNAFFGNEAGTNTTDGINNAAFGDAAGPTTGSLNNTVAFGADAKPSASNRGVIGNVNVTDFYFGSETAAARLHAAGVTVPTLTSGVSLAAPGNLQVTNEGTPGSTTYDYVIQAADAFGGWGGQAAVQTTTGPASLSGTDFNRLTWNAVAGASAYYVFRTAGAAQGVWVGLPDQLSFDDIGGDGFGGNRVGTNGNAYSPVHFGSGVVIGDYDNSAARALEIRGTGADFPGTLYTAHLYVNSFDASADIILRINPDQADEVPFNQFMYGLESSGYFYFSGPTNDGTGFAQLVRISPNLNVTEGPYPAIPGLVLRDTTLLVAEGGVVFPNSDPGVAGAWWNNGGTLTISTG